MTCERNIWAVLPVKEIDDAKSRLAHQCSPVFRRDLQRAMLEDVLDALTRTAALAGIVVVSVDRHAQVVATRYGARVFEDGARDGHTRAVMAAARRLASEGRAGMLTVPADVPAIAATEIARVLAAHDQAPAFTIVPSHDGRGSNAIVVSRPDAVELAFGNDSFVAHLCAARRAGIEPTIVTSPGIALDIDHPVDLARLMRTTSGPRTAAFLLGQSMNGTPTWDAAMQAER
jgi:2-phospho-L-lactate guanylyltransferase